MPYFLLIFVCISFGALARPPINASRMKLWTLHKFLFHGCLCFWQVSPYKRIREVTFIDAIPKSASGKILRRELVRLEQSKL